MNYIGKTILGTRKAVCSLLPGCQGGHEIWIGFRREEIINIWHFKDDQNADTLEYVQSLQYLGPYAITSTPYIKHSITSNYFKIFCTSLLTWIFWKMSVHDKLITLPCGKISRRMPMDVYRVKWKEFSAWSRWLENLSAAICATSESASDWTRPPSNFGFSFHIIFIPESLSYRVLGLFHRSVLTTCIDPKISHICIITIMIPY